MTQELPNQCSNLQSDGRWEEVIATIPQEREDLVLEVALVHSGGGGSEVELRTLVWGNGLGWYRQSTLRLDNATAQRLLGALGSVRRRIGPAKATPSVYRHDTRILAFPGNLETNTSRDDVPALLAR
jgi:hypothetical protein